jgi:hypothetical protein
VADPDEHDDVVQVRVEDLGFVRLTWRTGLRITGALAERAMGLVDQTNGSLERPLLVDMTATAQLRRDARMTFARRCSASRIALLGRSEVDRVIANFAVGVTSTPVPTRFFTSEAAAVAWLCGADAGR